MEQILFFAAGAVLVLVVNLLATWREARRTDQVLAVNNEVIRRLLMDNRSLQNRLSAKDLQGYMAQERFDRTQENNGAGTPMPERRPGYPQSVIGSS